MTPPTRLLRSLAVAVLVGGASIVLGHGSVGSSEADRSTERAIVFPDTENFETIVFDPHIHTVFSDGHVWPSVRVREAVLDGLDALAITEHLEWQPHLADLPHPDRNRAFEEAARAAAGGDLLIIPGSEITRDEPAGHMNALFVDDANALLRVANPPDDPSDTRAYLDEASRWPAEDAVGAARAQGAFVFWNHPYWPVTDGIARLTSFHRGLIDNGDLHGIEIANGNTYSAEAFAIALEHDLTLIGVSDVHDLIDWDYPPQENAHRPVTLVLAESRSVDAIRDALFARRTAVWFKNLLIARPPEMAELLDASLTIGAATRIADTSLTRVTIENASDARFVLKNASAHTFMSQGDRVQVPAHGSLTLTIKSDQSPLELNFVVENALLGPKTHPSWRATTTIDD